MVLVIIKALDILEWVARDSSRTYSLSEIAEGMQMNQATCVNILQTLVSKNYIEHLGRKKGYRLGPMAYNLTNNMSYSQNLVLAAKEPMEELTAELNETSILGIIRNQKRFIVHLVNSDQDLQVRLRTERNIYETASGRLLLAYLSNRELDSLIQSIGLPTTEVWPAATTPDELRSALAVIRGHELALTESVSHIIGLAVPVRKGGLVVASLSVFLPEVRYTGQRQQEIQAALQRTSQQITARLDA